MPKRVGGLQDIDGNELTGMGVTLAETFDREHIRNNEDTHLDGYVPDDKWWQASYKTIIYYLLFQCFLPNGLERILLDS